MTIRTIAAAITLAAFATAAGAQPARNGNIYDGTAHEPSAPNVQSNEKAAGIAPPPVQQQRTTSELEKLDQELSQKAQQDTQHSPQVGSQYGVQPGGVVQSSPGPQ